MYSERILDHYKNPHNIGKIEGVTPLTGDNPLCGDEIEIYIQGDEIKVNPNGCALLVASASMMTINRESIDPDLLEFIKNHPSRTKCVMLPWRTIDKSI